MGKYKLTLEDVKHRTSMQIWRLESFKKFLEDPNKEKRILDQECVGCFYDSKIGGAALTDSNCNLCDVVMHFGSTCTDRLCKPCAQANELCKHCGADIELNRNKNRTTFNIKEDGKRD